MAVVSWGLQDSVPFADAFIAACAVAFVWVEGRVEGHWINPGV